MEKTKEQKSEQRNEVIEKLLETLKCEYNDFSCVISVNDGTKTGTLCYGNAIDLIQNVISIEDNEVYNSVKKLKQTFDELSGINDN